MRTRNLILSVCAAGALFLAGTLVGANRFTKPSTILHVVTIKWKAEATDAQKTEVLKGVEKMAGEIPGVKSVWTKGIKVQGQGYTSAFVMEFENAAAFAAYADNPAHQEWNKMYQAVHEQSTTHDITN
ncbi:MAG TPA: Dabb family protein [Bryobacteraceae bacterium]|jgi:antibiotic biosynthesis monooxygenase (ABM) superfamily enzyme